MKVEVWPVHNRGALVDVSIMLHGARVHCAFFVDTTSMRLVRIFGDKSSQGRKVSAEVIREARQRAFDALADLEPQTERITSFAFAADVAS
jgi:hypothetical protein